jgi:hypothetical protein
MIEALESRRLCSVVSESETIAPASVSPATANTIPLNAGTFKGSSVSDKGFTTRLTVTLGKQLAGGSIIGTFDYLGTFKFTMHMRVGVGNTFHATITDGALIGTTTNGIVSTADKGRIIDLSGHFAFTGGQTDSDAGTFLVRS